MQQNTNFNAFQLLPPEICFMIWESAYEDWPGRVVKITSEGNFDTDNTFFFHNIQEPEPNDQVTALVQAPGQTAAFVQAPAPLDMVFTRLFGDYATDIRNSLTTLSLDCQAYSLYLHRFVKSWDHTGILKPLRNSLPKALKLTICCGCKCRKTLMSKENVLYWTVSPPRTPNNAAQQPQVTEESLALEFQYYCSYHKRRNPCFFIESFVEDSNGDPDSESDDDAEDGSDESPDEDSDGTSNKDFRIVFGDDSDDYDDSDDDPDLNAYYKYYILY
ncbi:hypothetical protein HYALB_00011519 [Hymenoscyphus albidus]|uniref:Uncharacterized protein n=1 Tax=Hymenoscyphus albidus TaxID=595503 RepID=A0A9N9Q4P6_9HELO|nr:hypothetical protein HYALB_00011519 [Hymenoscyphus albidus]